MLICSEGSSLHLLTPDSQSILQLLTLFYMSGKAESKGASNTDYGTFLLEIPQDITCYTFLGLLEIFKRFKRPLNNLQAIDN